MPHAGDYKIDPITFVMQLFDGKNWVPMKIEEELMAVTSQAVVNSIDREMMNLHKKEQEKAYDNAMKGIE